MQLNELKVVILCGGKGTRIKKFRKNLSKPLIKINGKTILERIIKIYSDQGFKNFLILTGYKDSQYKNFKLKGLNVQKFYTGLNSDTAERIYKVKKILKNNDFFLTYGDTIGNFSLKYIKKILNKNFIVSLCYYPIFFNKGTLKLKQNGFLDSFNEKNYKFYYNAGYYFVRKKIFNFINKKNKNFESEILNNLAKKNKVIGSQELTSWHPIDNKNDYNYVKKIIKK